MTNQENSGDSGQKPLCEACEVGIREQSLLPNTVQLMIIFIQRHGVTKSFQLSFNQLLSLFFSDEYTESQRKGWSKVMRPMNKGPGLEPHPLCLPGQGAPLATGQRLAAVLSPRAGVAGGKDAPPLSGHKPQVHGGSAQLASRWIPYFQSYSTFPGITSFCLV